MTTETIVRRKELKSITGLSLPTIYRMIARGDFPKPVKLSLQAVGWPHSVLMQWLSSRPHSL